MSPRQEIIDASGLVGLLLVFVFGYFAAILPVALSLLDAESPDIEADRRTLASRLQSYSLLVGGLLVLDLFVGAWLTPLTIVTIGGIRLAGLFPMVEVGLLVMDLMLITLLVATSWLLYRMRQRRKALLG